jgi:uncharacterized protein (DUF924 family)
LVKLLTRSFELLSDGKRAREGDRAAANRITAILKNEKRHHRSAAIRLGTFFKTSAEFWMNLQMTYGAKMQTEEFEDVLRFWFPDLSNANHAQLVRQFEWWFRGGADAAITERFASLLERAIRGDLDHWARQARSRLALIIVLDQFSRTLYRNTARAFAQDPKALKLALEGIEIGHYAALATPWEKTFFFLPVGHSEDFSHLERAVELAEELVECAPPEFRKILEHSASQARGHRDVIARFGRHPHRNAVLGRQSTPEELEYLARGEFVHTREVPK